MNDLNIYVSTSDGHLHAIKPFQFLFNKFWGEDQKKEEVRLWSALRKPARFLKKV